MTDLNPRTIATLYQRELMSVRALAKKYETTNWTISKILSDEGVKLRSRSESQKIRWKRDSKYSMNEKFFDSWSPNMAWVLGLMYADGHLWKDLTRAALTSGDISLLEQVRDLMESNFRIETKSTTPQLIIPGGDRTMKLHTYGMRPSNSLSCLFPEVPNEFLSHFVRGAWDGDGYISIRKTGWLSIGIDMGSEKFILGLKSVLDDVVGNVYYTVRHRKRRKYDGRTWGNFAPIHSLRIHGDRALTVCRWMYDGSTPDNRWEYKFSKVKSRM